MDFEASVRRITPGTGVELTFDDGSVQTGHLGAVRRSRMFLERDPNPIPIERVVAVLFDRSSTGDPAVPRESAGV